MMESVQSSGGNGAVANFYGELGLDRTWSVEQLRAKLGKLQLHWKRRASLAGKHGEEAREGLRVKMCVWLGVSRGLDLAFLNAD